MEESVNFAKGYGKVNPDDDNDDHKSTVPPSPNRRRSILAVVISIGLFTIIIGAVIGAAISHNHHRRTKPQQSSSVNAADSIKTVCAVTRHPESCFTSISAADSDGTVVDPELIFNLTLQIAVNELANISSLPKTLISKSHDLRTGSALRDCATLFDDALSQLSRSVEAMRSGEGEKVLTAGKVADMKTWISAAMTDQETCVDGLEEMGSTAVDEVKVRVQRSSECMSNSLAILGNMEALLDKFGLRLH